jgi:hypothetical protein
MTEMRIRQTIQETQESFATSEFSVINKIEKEYKQFVRLYIVNSQS